MNKNDVKQSVNIRDEPQKNEIYFFSESMSTQCGFDIMKLYLALFVSFVFVFFVMLLFHVIHKSP